MKELLDKVTEKITELEGHSLESLKQLDEKLRLLRSISFGLDVKIPEPEKPMTRRESAIEKVDSLASRFINPDFMDKIAGVIQDASKKFRNELKSKEEAKKEAEKEAERRESERGEKLAEISKQFLGPKKE